MLCFCHVPASATRNRFSAGITPILPPPPALQLLLALPALDPAERADIRIETGFAPISLPNIDLGGGPLARIALSLSMAAGSFKLDDLPMLELQMQNAASSFQRNIWPKLGFLTTLKIQPLLNFALVARLVLDLRALGIDPMTMQAGDVPAAPANSSFRFKLSPPKLAMARLAAGLPNIMQMNAALNIPPLGDPDAMSAMSNRLGGLASLSPPTLQIPFPLILKLAMVLESLAKIHEAFGASPFAPDTVASINSRLRFLARLNIPIPMPAIALNEKLKALPNFDDIKMGERIAGSAGASLSTSFKPPKLAIAPFLNVMVALHAAFNLVIDVDPIDPCPICQGA